MSNANVLPLSSLHGMLDRSTVSAKVRSPRAKTIAPKQQLQEAPVAPQSTIDQQSLEDPPTPNLLRKTKLKIINLNKDISIN